MKLKHIIIIVCVGLILAGLVIMTEPSEENAVAQAQMDAAQ